jgi:hypoxanthine-DNA glycosylase
MSRAMRRSPRAVETRARSFPPVVAPDARVLILGSMPGTASLAAGQYYAHPYNQFWRILGQLCGAGPELGYAERLIALQRSRVALWDVLDSCVRPGSLDAAIEHHSAIANDIPGLLRGAPLIRRVCCNGATAHHALRRYFGALLDARGVSVLRLPSTSPANARLRYEDKLAAWRIGLEVDAAVAANVAAPAGNVRAPRAGGAPAPHS